MKFVIGQLVREIGGKRLFTVHRAPGPDEPHLVIIATDNGREYHVDGSSFEILDEPEVVPALEPPKRRGRPPKAKP